MHGPGDSGLALASGSLLSRLLGFHPAPCACGIFGFTEKLRDGSPPGCRPPPAPIAPALAPHALDQLVRESRVARDHSREQIVLLGDGQLREPGVDIRWPRLDECEQIAIDSKELDEALE
jgi:hypothetical protein